jgi:hypothetical protein
MVARCISLEGAFPPDKGSFFIPRIFARREAHNSPADESSAEADDH